MKKTKINLSLLSMLGIIIAACTIISCGKNNNNGGGGGGGDTTVVLLGGYASSDSVAASSLIAYFPFDGDANDKKGGMTASVTGTITYPTGVKGQAYQGSMGTYATYTPSAAFSSLPSYSFSVWYYLPTENPAYGAATNQDTLTQGMFFLYGTNSFLLINEIEPFHGDSVRVHPGFNDLASPAYQGFVPETFNTDAIGKWVHFVVTYDGGSSTYTAYQNGAPTGANTAFSPAPPPDAANNPYPGSYITPNPLYTDGTQSTPLGNLGFSSDPPKTVIVGSWPDGLFGQSAIKNAFLGQLDEMRVFNKALSQSEVAGLYLNGKAGR